MALGNHFCLKVDNGWVKEESWLLTDGSDATLQAIELVVITSKLERKDEVLWVVYVGWHIFELELEGPSCGADTQGHVARGSFVVDFFVRRRLPIFT